MENIQHKELYLIEYGSSYSSDPWEPVCICMTEDDAKEYIKTKQNESLYHITKLPVYERS